MSKYQEYFDCKHDFPEHDYWASNCKKCGINERNLRWLQVVVTLEAQRDEAVAALDWILHVVSGVGKSGGTPEPDEYNDAFDSGKAAIANVKGE